MSSEPHPGATNRTRKNAPSRRLRGSDGPSEQSGVSRPLIKHFINLTDGIEVMEDLVELGVPRNEIGFVRIMSSQCEQDDFEGILMSLDHNLLMHLALGHICLIYDLGSRQLHWPDHAVGIPRAIWWGLEWTRFALSSCWKLGDGLASLRGRDVSNMFARRLLGISKKIKKKMRYYRTFLRTDRVNLFGVYRRTEHDADNDFYKKILWKFYPNPARDFRDFRDFYPDSASGQDSEEKASWRGQEYEKERFLERLGLKLPHGMAIFFAEKYLEMGVSAKKRSKEEKEDREGKR
ncbi:hypothetical protein AAMO2058_000799400 [Amorphochlora amoebiformis]